MYFRVFKGKDEYYHIEYKSKGDEEYKPYIDPEFEMNVSYYHKSLALHDATALRQIHKKEGN